MQNELTFGTDYNSLGKLIADLLQQKGCKHIKIKEDELNCCCPFHEEEQPSFGINLTTGAFNCFSCNAKGSITDFVAKMKNITNKEAWQELKKQNLVDDVSFGYTLEDFAAEKHLDVNFLKQYCLATSENGLSVAIPYFDENSKLVRTRFRNSPNNETRFYWDSQGSDITLYGLWNINHYKNDYVILVEGESDCLTLLAYNIPCIGVPGAKAFKKDYAKFFERFDKIFIHDEKDDGAKLFISGISGILPLNKLYLINSTSLGGKDPSELHIAGKLDIQALLNTAVPLANNQNSNEIENKKEEHVVFGEKLIEFLNLKYYNNEIYTYKNNKYQLADEKMLKNCIVHKIDINAKKTNVMKV